MANSMCRYPDTNPNGEAVAQWGEILDLNLGYDVKSNPDLCFVSSSIAAFCKQIVLHECPRSGYCPIIIGTKVGLKINSLGKRNGVTSEKATKANSLISPTLPQDLPDSSGIPTDIYLVFGMAWQRQPSPEADVISTSLACMKNVRHLPIMPKRSLLGVVNSRTF